MIADPVTGDVSLYHRVNLETGMYRGVKVMKGRNEDYTMMRIGIDAMGGDFAPLEALRGASLSKKAFPELD
jgi:hypothetical protein